MFDLESVVSIYHIALYVYLNSAKLSVHLR